MDTSKRSGEAGGLGGASPRAARPAWDQAMKRWLTIGFATTAVLGMRPALALTTYESPHYYEVPAAGVVAGSLFANVARLTMFDASGRSSACSGSLLWTGGHVLTAAHCLYSTYDTGFVASSAKVELPALGFSLTLDVDRSLTHQDWTGDVSNGFDLAILPLAGAGLPGGFEIDRSGFGMWGVGSDDPPFQLVAGWGLSGSGKIDEVVYPAGIALRAGFNHYDDLWSGIPGQPYMFDFDDYSDAHNAVGRNGTGWIPGYGEHVVLVDWDFAGDPVRGEAMIAPGDSGGPTLLEGLLVGVHSFFDGSGADIDDETNASFGELGADTRVFTYADWIDGRVAAAVPEPHGALMLAAGLMVLAGLRRRIV